MQSSPKLANAALALCMVVLPFGLGASAEPKAEVAAATSGWGQALGEGDPEKVLPLYSDDAVLWGTLSPTVRSDRAALRDYFVGAFKVLPSLKVTFGDQLIRVYGNAAVNTGYYTFSYVKDGETKTLPARYSFTYVKNGQRWLIVDHHSSAMPSTPR
ncbi:SgcJ/EcaC family oxidoreductase [Bradyrhizobium sp. sGM-13]|uniref:SgcJ/EcaC family oxidoreductase n=1 Tax=Bradyrhizobium sp. sGM-13 TaxID=2831781 RepID=UPI001BCA77C4|nr:SgcJ/EcaC family oxidoreductase [Bradyrhizobium sp. sGM-13]